jgi:DNA mismatch endonuclease (patch repair protein)
MKAKAASFAGLKPRSVKTSQRAHTSSIKSGTACERLLGIALHGAGLRYRTHANELVGCPDIVFPKSRVAVFVDGDFWHGRDLEKRLRRLRRGHNAKYWTRKIENNAARDRKIVAKLRRSGWSVMRFWESDIRRTTDLVVTRIAKMVAKRRNIAGNLKVGEKTGSGVAY